LQEQRQRLQSQEQLQGQGRLRNRRLQDAEVVLPARGHAHSGVALCTFTSWELAVPANRFNGFTEYGVGIGLRIPHYRHILSKKPVVDWFEIISENYMVDGGRPLEVLDQILEQYRVVQHGVAIYFGSADDLDKTHLKKLKRLVRRTNTPCLSDNPFL